MKHLLWIVLLSLLTPSAWSASNRKVSVEQLRDMLTTLQRDKKNDEEVSLQLKQTELTEQLTFAVMNTMGDLVPGQLSTEQMYVLEARSAMLPPPASDLPTAAPPDAAAQQAMLAKAQDYVSKTYAQLPHLTASRMTARFQDGAVAAPTYSSVQGGITDNKDPVFEQSKTWVRLMNTKTDTVESDNGVEKFVKDKTQWGPNGIAASIGQPLALNTAMQEIAANGNPKWLRWQSINGKQIAVYSFAVDKKKTHFSVSYCCFPSTDTTGTTHVGSPQGSGPGTNAAGNMQNNVEWNNFKANNGYHGELYLDPETGTVVRLIEAVDFKPSDFVHHDAVRTDYAPMTIGGKTLVVPIRTFNIAETVPNGDANTSHVTIRHQFVTQDIKDYK